MYVDYLIKIKIIFLLMSVTTNPSPLVPLSQSDKHLFMPNPLNLLVEKQAQDRLLS